MTELGFKRYDNKNCQKCTGHGSVRRTKLYERGHRESNSRVPILKLPYGAIMGLLHAAGICDLITHSRVKFREKHDGATGFV